MFKHSYRAAYILTLLGFSSLSQAATRVTLDKFSHLESVNINNLNGQCHWVDGLARIRF